jgi:hypothetical protein
MSPRQKASATQKPATKEKAAAQPVAAGKTSKKVNAASGRRGPRALSAEHKAQMARGRDEARIVRAYLDAIDNGAKRPGRRRSPEAINKQIAQVDALLRDAHGIDRLNLVKQRRDLEAARAEIAPVSDHGGLERDFVRVARSYGERRGIDYAMWREVGVPASVLTKAKVPRTRLSRAKGSKR